MKQKHHPKHHTDSINKKKSYKKHFPATKKELEGTLLISKDDILTMVSNGESLLHQLVFEGKIHELAEYLPRFTNTKKWIEGGKIQDGLAKDGVKKFYSSKMLKRICEYVHTHENYLDQRNMFLASIEKATGELPNCNRQEKSILSNKKENGTTYFPSNYKLIPINKSAGIGIKH